jgi:hypothetical protein
VCNQEVIRRVGKFFGAVPIERCFDVSREARADGEGSVPDLTPLPEEVIDSQGKPGVLSQRFRRNNALGLEGQGRFVRDVQHEYATFSSSHGPGFRGWPRCHVRSTASKRLAKSSAEKPVITPSLGRIFAAGTILIQAHAHNSKRTDPPVNEMVNRIGGSISKEFIVGCRLMKGDVWSSACSERVSTDGSNRPASSYGTTLKAILCKHGRCKHPRIGINIHVGASNGSTSARRSAGIIFFPKDKNFRVVFFQSE